MAEIDQEIYWVKRYSFLIPFIMFPGNNSVNNVLVQRVGLDAAGAEGGGFRGRRAGTEPVVSARDGRVRDGTRLWTGNYLLNYTAFSIGSVML